MPVAGKAGCFNLRNGCRWGMASALAEGAVGLPAVGSGGVGLGCD